MWSLEKLFNLRIHLGVVHIVIRGKLTSKTVRALQSFLSSMRLSGMTYIPVGHSRARMHVNALQICEDVVQIMLSEVNKDSAKLLKRVAPNSAILLRVQQKRLEYAVEKRGPEGNHECPHCACKSVPVVVCLRQNLITNC